MANTTGIELHFHAEDQDYFDEIAEVVIDSPKAPGLMQSSIGDIKPSDLNEFGERMFVGFHGSHSGDYPAHALCCNGDGNIYTHPCDENGDLSLIATNVWNPQGPIEIPTYTLNFMLSFRSILEKMLDRAARTLEEKLAKMEAEEEAKKSGDIDGEAPEGSGAP